MQILIVDDEPRSALLLKDLVQKFYKNDVEIAIANTEKEALNYVAIGHLDLLLLDVELNGRSAFDLLDKITKRDFPFIITSASRQFAFQTFEYGGSGYVLKPLNAQDINTVLDRMPNLKPISQPNPPLTNQNPPETQR